MGEQRDKNEDPVYLCDSDLPSEILIIKDGIINLSQQSFTRLYENASRLQYGDMFDPTGIPTEPWCNKLEGFWNQIFEYLHITTGDIASDPIKLSDLKDYQRSWIEHNSAMATIDTSNGLVEQVPVIRKTAKFPGHIRDAPLTGATTCIGFIPILNTDDGYGLLVATQPRGGKITADNMESNLIHSFGRVIYYKRYAEVTENGLMFGDDRQDIAMTINADLLDRRIVNILMLALELLHEKQELEDTRYQFLMSKLQAKYKEYTIHMQRLDMEAQKMPEPADERDFPFDWWD